MIELNNIISLGKMVHVNMSINTKNRAL